MVRVALIGQGYVATIFAWGFRRLRQGSLSLMGFLSGI
jgi:myo-inositol-1-phosphate synthase